MMRNEDFLLLHCGQPDFICEHSRRNSADYIAGDFVGSECYIPAENYLDKPDLPDRATYAFQRQWLFYSQ